MALKNIKKALFGNDDEPNTVDEIEEEFYTITQKEYKEAEEVNGSKMILVEPRAYSESQTIADHLKKRNSVVVNLKRVTSDQAKRIIDFLTGTLYAIGGDLQKLGNGIYLCTPKNVTVQGKMTEAEETKAKAKIEDEIDF
ncbi:MAG: cell division protein SepF [Mollicutes bacterium]|jgi:cell division inhibitor SepF|nr:cell division protein SepF [Mollicutes bacterium]